MIKNNQVNDENCLKSYKLDQIIEVTYDFIKELLIKYCNKMNINSIDINETTYKINRSLVKSMKMYDILNYIANYIVTKTSYHPDYKKIASRIVVDMLHLATTSDYLQVVEECYNNYDKQGNHSPLISQKFYEIVKNNSSEIQNMLNYKNDYLFDFFGLKTLERSYLLKVRFLKENDQLKDINKIVERPQHMFMRVAICLHDDNLEKVKETYDLLSNRYMIHATPTLFNAGSRCQQLSSCFLLNMEDSLDKIYDTKKELALISKWAGGIGFSLSKIRCKGSLIRGTNGISDGIIPLCQTLSAEGRYVNQGGKRNGSISVYLEVWHGDIYEFCQLRKNTNSDDSSTTDKARDLFLGLWVNDIFMKRVSENGVWSLMCPDKCPGLVESYGEDFNKLYEKYEKEGRYIKQVRAVHLWYYILSCQIETGIPYMLFKDACNIKSNQKNLGTITSSNLCTEIIEYTDDKNTSVCNLATVCLPKYIIHDLNNNMDIDYKLLEKVVRVAVNNLNNVIDKNYYPSEKAKYSNFTHRPIGIGIQGLADMYNIMGLPFASDKSRLLNKKIFETIYYAAISESCNLAKKYGHYSSFDGSPFSQGLLQFHLWNIDQKDLLMNFDWNDLINQVKTYGTRNSLLTTCPPTASTAQICGNSESFEPHLTNIYQRSTLAGEFIVINENLVNDLIKLNLWNDLMRKKIIVYNGSIQEIDEIPSHIKEIYKTAFEIKMKDILIQSVERGPFIDQSQSLNLFMETSDFDRLTSSHMFAWKNGLKTAMYYLRTRPAVDPIQFGIDEKDIALIKNKKINIINNINNNDNNNNNNNNNIYKNNNLSNIDVEFSDAESIYNSDISNNSDNSNNSNSDSMNDDEEPILICKYRPGIKITECTMCT